MKFTRMKALFGRSGDRQQSIPATTPTGGLPSPDYNDFNYWKPNLPDIEGELPGGNHGNKTKTKKTTSEMSRLSEKKSEDLDKFNAFNFWKDPLPEIDLNIL